MRSGPLPIMSDQPDTLDDMDGIIGDVLKKVEPVPEKKPVIELVPDATPDPWLKRVPSLLDGFVASHAVESYTLTSDFDFKVVIGGGKDGVLRFKEMLEKDFIGMGTLFDAEVKGTVIRGRGHYIVIGQKGSAA